MSPLIEIEELRSEKGPIILIDARAGADTRQRYDAGHLEGAQFADLDKDLTLLPENAANGGRERVAIEISAESARELVRAILSALESGEQEHAAAQAACPAEASAG